MATATLGDAQIMSIVRGVGWTGQDAIIATAVAIAESGGNPAAVNTNTNGSTDRGLFQVNSIHSALIAGRNLNDPGINAQIAYQIFKNAGNRWTPWSAYNNRSYAKFLGRAQSVATASSEPVNTSDWPKLSETSDSWVSTITNPETWRRIGLIAAGILMLLLVASTVVKVPLNPASLARKVVR